MHVLRKTRTRFAEGHLLPWRWTHLGGFWNTVIRTPVRRRMLRKSFEKSIACLPDEVTVVIGVRNRIDHKIENTLASLRCQKGSGCHVHLIVIDYDNSPELSQAISKICQAYDALQVVVTGEPEWNKPHCYNIGIRMAQTKYLMSCDADILFAENYLATALDVLRRQPLSVVYSQMLDTPESCVDELQEWAKTRRSSNLQALRRKSTPRSSGDCNEGINMTYTYYYHLVRGYDEYYTKWGTEDSDLQKRFRFLGLDIVSVKDQTFYLHQWHPKFASLDAEKVHQAHIRNQAYFRRTNTIVRNPSGWGMPSEEIRLRPSGRTA